MWSNFIQYYKDPCLVANFQEYFGIRIHYNNDEINSLKDVSDIVENTNGYADNTKRVLRNKKVIYDQSSVYQQSDENTRPSPSRKSSKPFSIQNSFWYYLFLFGTELGDEIFYTSFIPFWFWNIDGAVGRRIVLVWATTMSIGQALKDVLCWPRPSCPPAVRVQEKWSLEYGMPSTHAMIAVAIPFSVLIFTMNRYVYPFYVGLLIAMLWCTLICMSRIYLGMHTVLDIFAGLTLAVGIMIPLVPLVDALDHHFLSNNWAILALVLVSIASVIYYPCSDKWTPTRGDTTLVIAVTTGIYVGAWMNFKTGALTMPQEPPPYDIIWPSYPMIGRTVLRTVLGFCCILGTKALCKSLSYATLCAILKINSKELMQSEDSLDNKNKILVDLVYKYIACFLIGVNILYVLPNVFTMIGIERPTFYTEL